MYARLNKPQSEMTARPEKYPQGYFKRKPCKNCSKEFEPLAPSHLACSQECADRLRDERYLRRVYSIGVTDYETLHSAQQGRCAICKGPGFCMTERHKMMLVVDHCHVSGKVRGLLCHNCNRALGLLKDSPEVLEAAKKYLEGATTIPKGSTLK